jgi:DNA repair exonuclease SbcCD ATPase subunit
MYLRRLSISGFRGVGQHLDLPLDHRTIIYGPNGSGKSSLLQSIAWTIYGKLPVLKGTVFTREDALVNDFLDDARAEITLTLSDDVSITRTRDKQNSTGRGKNPLTISFETDDPQVDVERLVGLSLEEFFAAALLHQEMIRDFITTTPEKRNVTIDRMLGTYLLRTLVKTVDPSVPAKAIEEAEQAIRRLDQSLTQASVISREMIQKRKEEYGDPAELPQLLEDIHQDLVPIARTLETPIPEATLVALEKSLDSVRQSQLETISNLEGRVGRLGALKERYEQAAVTGWQTIHQRREQYGDPADLPDLLKEILQDLAPIARKLELPTPKATIADLEESLATARRAQPNNVGELGKEAEQLSTLKERYEQIAVTGWQTIHQRREQYGDPADLPDLLKEILRDLTPITEKLELPTPKATIADLETSLAAVRRAQPNVIGDLGKMAGQLSTLQVRYEQTSKEVVKDASVPPELENRRDQFQDQIKALNQDVPALTRRWEKRQAIEQELAELRAQVRALPELRAEIEQMQKDLDALEAAGKQSTLYNQVLTTGQEYLEQAQPENCPLCKQQIADLQALLVILRQETPADVEKMRQEFKTLREMLAQKQNQVTQLEQGQKRIETLEVELREFPEDLESQIEKKRQESEKLANELATVQAEITQIEGRIALATEHRNRLKAVLKEVEQALGRSSGEDVVADLDQALQSTRERTDEIQTLDLQPIAAKLDRSRQLDQIKTDEAQLRQRQDVVFNQVQEALGHPLGEDVTADIDQAIKGIRERVVEIQALDFQPISAGLDRAKQLRQIEKDETQLHERLDAVLGEVAKALGRQPDEDVADALDQAIEAARARATEIQALNFQPVAKKLDRAKQLDEIQKDELRLHQFESSYQTASREKARLSYQIQRLTELRNALQDISETTKSHNQQIVTGILDALDIHRYYQQLDPHPAYRQLQIEPELSKAGTYNYWIKALTDDRSRGTYVQTRFSTAQANCAAIAIFLAVNQHLSKKLETIILDDPSQSMDPKYKRRLAETLAAIPRQVIVATEDPQLFELLVDIFDAPTIHELSPWTIDGASLVS